MNYVNCSLTPPYPPSSSGGDNTGYMWAYYQTTPQAWQKAALAGEDVIGFYILNDIQTYTELIGNQIKPNIKFNQAVFYIWPITSVLDFNLTSARGGFQINSETRHYAFVQLGKYRAYNTYDRMRANLVNLLAFFSIVNPHVKKTSIKSTDLRRQGDDNDFTELLTAEIVIRGLSDNPILGCTPNIQY